MVPLPTPSATAVRASDDDDLASGYDDHAAATCASTFHMKMLHYALLPPLGRPLPC